MLVNHELNSLLQKIAQRNWTALGDFYDSTVRYVYGLAMHITADIRLSERITQNVYLYIWHNVHSLKNSDVPPIEWLINITRYQIMLDCSFEEQQSSFRSRSKGHDDPV